MIGEIGLTARMASLTEIWYQIAGCHDGFGLVDDGRGGDAGGGTQGLQDVMHLRLVLAIGAHALPHEGHGIQPHDLGALVGKVENDVGDSEENLRIGPVQVPLVFVEGGPDPFLEFGIMGEASWGIIGENFNEAALILLRHRVGGEHPIVFLVFFVALLGLFGPRMFFGCVVEYEIDANAHATGPKGRRHLLEIRHGAKARVNRTIIHHRITAVIGTGAGFQAGHEVDVGDAQGFQIFDVIEHALQIACKTVDVENIAHRVFGEEPVRCDVTGKIQLL